MTVTEAALVTALVPTTQIPGQRRLRQQPRTQRAPRAVTPRPRRVQPQPVDVTVFTDRIEQALAAFGSDVHYSVLMARAAVSITRKRTGWYSARSRHAPDKSETHSSAS